MCGRFTSTSSLEALVEEYGVDVIRTGPLPPRYNVAPTLPIYAVANRRATTPSTSPQRALGTFRWGLVPSWAKDISVGSKMINARAEGIGERPAFRKAYLSRRCVIPIDAFYEWQARPGTKTKLPWAIRRRDRSPMSMAGLWEIWRDPSNPDATPLRSCAIVTTVANASLRSIHERMPVVLGPDAVNRWLDPSLADRAELDAMLAPAPDDWFDAYPVSTLVNKVTLDGPELLEPTIAAPADSTTEAGSMEFPGVSPGPNPR